ncbi:hypothetical protein [Aliiglaciecola sp. CAU 1673]|uniref:hypothetical protein n=1 Tax=Aliiglaciecola sp. CAU 1673 TaxID=3032595 RepID=UPI0023DAA264|nr:hypothetical protein [Aliiglaciecola sp. CAU 1673]
MKRTTSNAHSILSLGVDAQAVLRASIGSAEWLDTQGTEISAMRHLEALLAPQTSVTELPMELQDILMDYLFEDEQFESRGVYPEDFDEMIFGARPGDIHNIRLRDTLSYRWEPLMDDEQVDELIGSEIPIIILSPSLIYIGRHRDKS